MEGASFLSGPCFVGDPGFAQGYQCKATDAELQRFLSYKPRGLCPQDWYFSQKLMYAKDCFALPRRRCLSITPPEPEEVRRPPAPLVPGGPSLMRCAVSAYGRPWIVPHALVALTAGKEEGRSVQRCVSLLETGRAAASRTLALASSLRPLLTYALAVSGGMRPVRLCVCSRCRSRRRCSSRGR